MLFLLREPAGFLGAGLAFVVAVVVHSLAQAVAARAAGDRLPTASGRLSPDPRRHLDAFGVIVMLVSAIGWNKPVPLQEPRFRGGRTRYLLSILAGPFANLLVGALFLVLLRVVGDVVELTSIDPIDVGRLSFGEVLLYELATVNAAVGVLTLLPIPPLDGARVLWLFAPQTPGWRNARYQLDERNIGLGIVVLLSLPLFGGTGLLRAIVLAISSAFLAPLAAALGFIVRF